MIDPVARARSALGTPFKLQGREPGSGLDCLGLVIHAFRLDGGIFPQAYGWRQADACDFLAAAARDFFVIDAVFANSGDVLRFSQGLHRHHLAIATCNGVIHADARHRRVIERNGDPGLPLVAVHRFRPPFRRSL
ncbi:peptidoglycan endopeptidase [Sphingomicrobium aestuariivivum]|uniref:peptidoglycan endopeptidase n=1 Tax=Sphingomicrobium aestuariivivum TaxID=1582356 RepID=UPI001FD6A48C|nr:peptidoglycan endopeptidase [Sphingomicrobium aestuariivivum]MCJ8191783.1 peptidoglycan endopeptidase [Sphingomicrobium aestuariivivum]